MADARVLSAIFRCLSFVCLFLACCDAQTGRPNVAPPSIAQRICDLAGVEIVPGMTYDVTQCPGSNRCLLSSSVINGIYDCQDATTDAYFQSKICTLNGVEIVPGTGLTFNVWRCPNSNKCLLDVWLMDGVNDCGDGSDEDACSMFPTLCPAPIKTMKDVKQCMRANVAEFMKACENKFPAGKTAELRKCFEDENKDGFPNSFASCLIAKGLGDNDACLPYDVGPPGGRRASWELSGIFPLPLPVEKQALLLPFMSCAINTIADKDGCTKGCTSDSYTSSMAFLDCANIMTAAALRNETTGFSECVRKYL